MTSYPSIWRCLSSHTIATVSTRANMGLTVVLAATFTPTTPPVYAETFVANDSKQSASFLRRSLSAMFLYAALSSWPSHLGILAALLQFYSCASTHAETYMPIAVPSQAPLDWPTENRPHRRCVVLIGFNGVCKVKPSASATQLAAKQLVILLRLSCS